MTYCFSHFVTSLARLNNFNLKTWPNALIRIDKCCAQALAIQVCDVNV